MKKLLCISLIITLIFLTACAGNTETQKPESSAEPAESAAPTEELYEGDEVVSTANIEDINYYSGFTNEDKTTVESFSGKGTPGRNQSFDISDRRRAHVTVIEKAIEKVLP